jgi:hypothetical protein
MRRDWTMQAGSRAAVERPIIILAAGRVLANRSPRFAEKPVLASADAAWRRCTQKFFRCQKSRLGDHAACF